MNRFIAYINTKKYIIERDNENYIYNGEVLEKDLVDKFISNIIKLCLNSERRKKFSSSNKIEIFFSDRTSIFTGIDNQVIKYLNDFLK